VKYSFDVRNNLGHHPPTDGRVLIFEVVAKIAQRARSTHVRANGRKRASLACGFHGASLLGGRLRAPLNVRLTARYVAQSV
jgi:prophage maintenance system killer protein